MSDLTKSEMPLSVFKTRLLATVILLNLLIYSPAEVSLYQSRINYEKKAAVSTQTWPTSLTFISKNRQI
jgi:hypothetical protein